METPHTAADKLEKGNSSSGNASDIPDKNPVEGPFPPEVPNLDTQTTLVNGIFAFLVDKYTKNSKLSGIASSENHALTEEVEQQNQMSASPRLLRHLFRWEKDKEPDRLPVTRKCMSIPDSVQCFFGTDISQYSRKMCPWLSQTGSFSRQRFEFLDFPTVRLYARPSPPE